MSFAFRIFVILVLIVIDNGCGILSASNGYVSISPVILIDAFAILRFVVLDVSHVDLSMYVSTLSMSSLSGSSKFISFLVENLLSMSICSHFGILSTASSNVKYVSIFLIFPFFFPSFVF